MSETSGGVSRERPVLLGRTGQSRSIRVLGGGSARVVFRDPERQASRLDARFREAMAAFGTQVELSESLQAADPELVLVFEALDEHVNLTQVARKLGFEVLAEVESAIEPTEDYALISSKPRDPLIGTCLHAICLNQQAFNRLLGLWRTWKSKRSLHGYAVLRDLFSHLKDVRPWGPQDRLKMIDWDNYLAGQITDGPHSIELELWYRGSSQARVAAQRKVEALIIQAGGRILSSVMIDQIGYHGLKCQVPASMLLDLAQGRIEQVRVVKSADVMFLRITGQSMVPESPATDLPMPTEAPLPLRPPVVCILDGVPVENHPLLADRVVVYDPDDLSSAAPADQRRHGTQMSSVVVWGDRSRSEQPSDRQVLVRPILTPSEETAEGLEELPASELTPDLMWRVFRELFEADGSGTAAAAPDVAIINLSVGDPSTPYDSILSSWARMIDWLSYKYGVLVVVSAGNYPRLPLARLNTVELTTLTGDERRKAVLNAQFDDQLNRRLISPAESINAVTVGAVHADGSGSLRPGYIVDPADGLLSVSPVSALGGGYRRSLKPDLAAPGGRVIFPKPFVASETLVFANPSAGPGIRVASQGPNREAFIAGTSPAAALVTRAAANLYDALDAITAGAPLSRHQRAAALKALVIHSTDRLSDLASDLHVEHAIGNGVLIRDLSQGCATNEAVVLFVGSLAAAQEQELPLPLPDGLSKRGTKRITATLAWISPVNWRHRQYRRAALSFVKPSGAIPDPGVASGLTAESSKRGATTAQHLTWEMQGAFAGGRGSDLSLRVKCLEQAGGLDGERIDYAVALSLWVAPTLNVDVYHQVRQQIQTRVPVQSRS